MAAAGGGGKASKGNVGSSDDESIKLYTSAMDAVRKDVELAVESLKDWTDRCNSKAIDHSAQPSLVLDGQQLAFYKEWLSASESFKGKKKTDAGIARWGIDGGKFENVAPASIVRRAKRIEAKLRQPAHALKYISRLPPYQESILAGMVRAQQSTAHPMQASGILREASRIERLFQPEMDVTKQKSFSRSWLEGFKAREGLKVIKAERKSVKRVQAENPESLMKWFFEEGAFRGLVVNKRSGVVTGTDKCRFLGNMDEVLCIMEPTSGQKEQVDGAVHVVVDQALERAESVSPSLPTSCVGLAPWVVQGYGMVTCVLCFKYDGKTQHVSKSFVDEQRFVKSRLEAVGESDWDDVVADISMSCKIAPPSPTQLQFLAHEKENVRNAAGGPEFVYLSTTTGRLNVGAMLAGAQHFCNQLPRVRKEMKLPAEEIMYMYMDNLSFHHSKVVEDYLWENGRCKIRFLLKYTTAVTQPEDVSCNAPFKRRFRGLKTAVPNYLEAVLKSKAFQDDVPMVKRAHVIRDVCTGKLGEQWVGPMLCAAARDSFTKKNVNSGFRKCGLLPFDPSAISGLVKGCRDMRIKRASGLRPKISTAGEALMLVPSDDGHIPAACPPSSTLAADLPRKRPRTRATSRPSSGAGGDVMRILGWDVEELIRDRARDEAEDMEAKFDTLGTSKPRMKVLVGSYTTQKFTEDTRVTGSSLRKKPEKGLGRRAAILSGGGAGTGHDLAIRTQMRRPQEEWSKEVYSLAYEERGKKISTLEAEIARLKSHQGGAAAPQQKKRRSSSSHKLSKGR